MESLKKTDAGNDSIAFEIPAGSRMRSKVPDSLQQTSKRPALSIEELKEKLKDAEQRRMRIREARIHNTILHRQRPTREVKASNIETGAGPSNVTPGSIKKISNDMHAAVNRPNNVTPGSIKKISNDMHAAVNRPNNVTPGSMKKISNDMHAAVNGPNNVTHEVVKGLSFGTHEAVKEPNNVTPGLIKKISNDVHAAVKGPSHVTHAAMNGTSNITHGSVKRKGSDSHDAEKGQSMMGNNKMNDEHGVIKYRINNKYEAVKGPSNNTHEAVKGPSNNTHEAMEGPINNTHEAMEGKNAPHGRNDKLFEVINGKTYMRNNVMFSSAKLSTHAKLKQNGTFEGVKAQTNVLVERNGKQVARGNHKQGIDHEARVTEGEKIDAKVEKSKMTVDKIRQKLEEAEVRKREFLYRKLEQIWSRREKYLRRVMESSRYSDEGQLLRSKSGGISFDLPIKLLNEPSAPIGERSGMPERLWKESDKREPPRPDDWMEKQLRAEERRQEFKEARIQRINERREEVNRLHAAVSGLLQQEAQSRGLSVADMTPPMDHKQTQQAYQDAINGFEKINAQMKTDLDRSKSFIKLFHELQKPSGGSKKHVVERTTPDTTSTTSSEVDTLPRKTREQSHSSSSGNESLQRLFALRKSIMSGSEHSNTSSNDERRERSYPTLDGIESLPALFKLRNSKMIGSDSNSSATISVSGIMPRSVVLSDGTTSNEESDLQLDWPMRHKSPK